MKLEETYNIHKKINHVLPFFKSKRLCNKGIHNYVLNYYFEPNHTYYLDKYNPILTFGLPMPGVEIGEANKTNLKCLCCGKEIELEE